MSKRENEDSASDQPPRKKAVTSASYEPIKFNSIHSLEELDVRVLQIQNKRLFDRLQERRKAEDGFRERIEQLERRQTKDDELVCIINRYWNQLDEDVRQLLTRFDGESASLEEDKKSSSAESFLKQLGSWDSDELNDRLRQRVEFSTRAIAKLVGAFDRLLLRCNTLRQAVVIKRKIIVDDIDDLPSADDESKAAAAAAVAAAVDDHDKSDTVRSDEQLKADNAAAADSGIDATKLPAAGKKMPSQSANCSASGESADTKLDVNEALRAELEQIHAENSRLHNLHTQLQERLRAVNLRAMKLEEQVQLNEESSAEWHNKHDDILYNYERAQLKTHRLEKQLAEAVEELKRLREQFEDASSSSSGNNNNNSTAGNNSSSTGNVAKSKYRELASELEEQRELAATRLAELDSLQAKFDQRVRDCERMRLDLKELPDSVIVESPAYQALKSQFNLLYTDALLVRSQLQKTTQQVQENRLAHNRQIELMESHELACQTQMRKEMILLEQQNSIMKQELESQKLELEQMLAQNEHAVPINSEMRSLIGTLQDQNKHLKSEILRHRKKSHSLQAEADKYRSLCRQMEEELMKLRGKVTTTAAAVDKDHSAATAADSTAATTAAAVKPDVDKLATADASGVKQEPTEVSEEQQQQLARSDEKSDSSHSPASSTLVQNLKQQLKKTQDRVKELTQLLEVQKGITREQRDLAALVAAEAKLKSDLEESRAEAHRLRERERKFLAENDMARRLRRAEETLHHCQQKLTTSKQEQEVMLKEMEVSELAFSDVQDQNLRLLKQLKEKDDANIKLVTERLKGEKMQRLLREEKEVLTEELRILGTKLEAQNLVVHKLEEKERLLLGNISTLEKEVNVRQQALDIFKRRSAEHQQTAQDLKLNLDKYLSQVRELQAAVQEKAAVIEKEGFRHKRLLEDLATLKRKHDRLKKIEESSNADEVLLAEIADYKEQLTCPCCKVKRKDAILTKCFHVFCLDCLKTRYETRNRKCPKCNAAFGANDFHRVYLS